MNAFASARPATRALAVLTLGFALLVALVASAMARVEIDISKGNVEPLPIAIPAFLGETELGRQIADVVQADLKRSGLFAPIDRAAFIEQITDSNVRPNFPDW